MCFFSVFKKCFFLQLLVEESSRRGKEKKRTKRKRDKDKERMLMLQGLGGVLGNVGSSTNSSALSATPILPTAGANPSLLKSNASPGMDVTHLRHSVQDFVTSPQDFKLEYSSEYYGEL